MTAKVLQGLVVAFPTLRRLLQPQAIQFRASAPARPALAVVPQEPAVPVPQVVEVRLVLLGQEGRLGMVGLVEQRERQEGLEQGPVAEPRELVALAFQLESNEPIPLWPKHFPTREQAFVWALSLQSDRQG